MLIIRALLFLRVIMLSYWTSIILDILDKARRSVLPIAGVNHINKITELLLFLDYFWSSGNSQLWSPLWSLYHPRDTAYTPRTAERGVIYKYMVKDTIGEAQIRLGVLSSHCLMRIYHYLNTFRHDVQPRRWAMTFSLDVITAAYQTGTSSRGFRARRAVLVQKAPHSTEMTCCLCRFGELHYCISPIIGEWSSKGESVSC